MYSYIYESVCLSTWRLNRRMMTRYQENGYQSIHFQLDMLGVRLCLCLCCGCGCMDAKRLI